MRQKVRHDRNMKEDVYLNIGTKFNHIILPYLSSLYFYAGVASESDLYCHREPREIKPVERIEVSTSNEQQSTSFDF